MRRKSLAVTLGLATMLSLGSAASAGQLDLTSGGTGVINGATFSTTEQQPTGSGVIHSFVRISAANQDAVEGYNTDARPLQFDENTSPTFTRSLHLDALVSSNGYYQFLLDINQTSANPNLTLNELQIFLGNSATLTGATKPDATTGTLSFGTNANLVYDMDALEDSKIQLNYSLNSGSGSGDMYAYIPTSLFTGTNKWVTLYSKFGPLEFANNDGFEEWATIANPNLVPLPAAAWGGMALCGFIGAAKIRRRQNSDSAA